MCVYIIYIIYNAHTYENYLAELKEQNVWKDSSKHSFLFCFVLFFNYNKKMLGAFNLQNKINVTHKKIPNKV